MTKCAGLIASEEMMTGLGRNGLGRLSVIAAAGTIAVMAAAGPAAGQLRVQATSGWPQFQGNARHTGAERGEDSVTRANVGQLRVAWTADLPSASDNSEVVVTGGVAYAAAGDTVTAFDATSGTQLWQALLPGSVLGTPSVQRGLVLVAISETIGPRHHIKSLVEALSSAAGVSVWMRPVSALTTPSLASSTTITTTADRAYVTLGSGQVEAIGISHGNKIWQSAVLPGCSLSQPSAAGGLLIVGGGGGYVSALKGSDGAVAWQDTLGGGCGAAAGNWLPAISQGTVYAGLLDGVDALKLASGTVLWQNKSVTSVFFPPSLTGNEVIVSSDNSTQLAALSRFGGTLKWQSTFPVGSEVAGAAIFGSLMWALVQSPDAGGVRAVALGPLTGRQIFSTASYADQTQGFAPVVDAGHVYVNLGNELLCLALPASS
jgi:outer membrane protein assembly factor BamB